MKPFACGATALCLMPACLMPLTLARAQNQAVDDLKGKIFDARMAKQTFTGGLKFCSELDGKHFYFQARDRVLDLEEYHHSLENLAKERVFNFEKHRPWTEQDAAVRWDLVQKQAASDSRRLPASGEPSHARKAVSSMRRKRTLRGPRRKTDRAGWPRFGESHR